MTNETSDLTLASGLTARITTGGAGNPLVFLHNHLGHGWDAFLDGLAATHRVIAPRHPGCEEPDELMQFDGFSDLALFYDDLLNALGVDRVTLVGHGFGGMAAAEFAAQYPQRVSHLVLIDALGLWRDELPIPDISALPADEVGRILTGSPALTKTLTTAPENPEAAPDWLVARFLTQAAVSHFIWPIPDRDLKRRLYRITAPTLVVWGAADAYVPPAYADDFCSALQNARKVMVEGAGHMPHLEDTASVLESIGAFVG